ncbi:MAG: phosphoribosylformylglycinamidine cyclo-ligase [Robiginitomaculum sp.]|nr:MAG: phosphoribosylformylglycinamidine cyclo-ligase [Robiginitomaculum sp.]
MVKKKQNGLSYAQAGVDINAGDALVARLRTLTKATMRPGADTGLGGFGGAFDLKAAGFNDPILISGTDGVGTKLKVAVESGLTGTVGIDLVAMCVNDVLAQGAEPLFFLDYFACGQLNPEAAATVIAGIADGCVNAGCALIGGETAEMPGMYSGDDFDLAGFVVGAAERDQILPQKDHMHAGDALIALASSGPHSNGYSLIRAVVKLAGLDWDAPSPFASGKTLGESLMTPTRIYVRSLSPLLRSGIIKGLAHITGGGLIENPPRMLPAHLQANIDDDSWQWPDVFNWLAQTGGVRTHEMRRTFNCGIGMLCVVAKEDASAVVQDLCATGETAWIAGKLGEKA